MEILSSFQSALIKLHRILTELQIPYCIIGGLAAQVHAEPRFTRDIDISIVAELEFLEEMVDKILKRIAPRFDDARNIALQAQILPLTIEGVEVDLTLGLTGFERTLLSRAVAVELLPGCLFPLCTKEDLAIMKSLAGRDRDMFDLRALIRKNGTNLDVEYIKNTLKEFSAVLDDPTALQRFELVISSDSAV